MKLNKDDIYGIVGSVAFHAIILLLLWFAVLKTVIPEEEDGGILVNFGNVNAAAGTFEPKYTGEVPKQTTPPPPPPAPTPKVEAPKEELVTQEIEESIAIEQAQKEKKKKEEAAKKAKEKAKAEAARKQKEEAERKRRIEEEKRKREEAIKNKVAGAFGGGTSGTGNQGDSDTKAAGNQGSPFGNSDKGANEGVGGYGSFALNGRNLGPGGLPRPTYTSQDEGRIVVNITVNTQGNVIFSEIGKGTNIDNATMRKGALTAAKKAKFNSIKGNNNQSGTITYRYVLK